MLTTADTLRDLATALDFVHGYNVEGLRTMGSLSIVVQRYQELQIQLAEAEEALKKHIASGSRQVPKAKKLN